MPIRTWLRNVHRRDNQPVHRGALVLSGHPALAAGVVMRPAPSNRLEFALHRAQHAAQLRGNLLVGVALGLPERDRLELGIVQCTQEPLAFFSYLGDEFGRGLVAGDLIGVRFRGQGSCRRWPASIGWLTIGSGTPSFLAILTTHLIDRHARCHRDQNPPQAFPVANLGKSSLLGPVTKSGKRRQRHIFFIDRAAGMVRQLPAGQSHQLLKIAFPQQPGRRVIAGFELVERTTN